MTKKVYQETQDTSDPTLAQRELSTEKKENSNSEDKLQTQRLARKEFM